MIKYPEQLPSILLSGYSIEQVDSTVRTPMSSGRERVRRRFESVPEYPQGSVLMTPNQAAFFRAWFERALSGGVRWFTCRLKMPEILTGTAEFECRFRGKYSCRLVPPSMWEFAFVLELREQSLIPPGWEQFPDYWFNMNILDLAMNRDGHWPEA
ncbi:TPA: transposase [Pseudomonas aeruginosa]